MITKNSHYGFDSKFHDKLCASELKDMNKFFSIERNSSDLAVQMVVQYRVGKGTKTVKIQFGGERDYQHRDGLTHLFFNDGKLAFSHSDKPKSRKDIFIVEKIKNVKFLENGVDKKILKVDRDPDAFSPDRDDRMDFVFSLHNDAEYEKISEIPDWESPECDISRSVVVSKVDVNEFLKTLKSEDIQKLSEFMNGNFWIFKATWRVSEEILDRTGFEHFTVPRLFKFIIRKDKLGIFNEHIETSRTSFSEYPLSCCSDSVQTDMKINGNIVQKGFERFSKFLISEFSKIKELSF